MSKEKLNERAQFVASNIALFRTVYQQTVFMSSGE